ncbi:glycoside hydrolase family 16 protein [Flavobacterium sp. HXWNR69]|uniref:Glycoside hydrolase family 16 protein n=2 Tax=Flavobacterium fragile TaxID=2949085 RepID=A0ABT0THK3_9FLAO|nr:glycoside hydrolase family 16 protein [Flavobacterium sp. HXWNR69]MCL9770056.1 glycoside hydrolase family 16 protein [Flavobacterium sp. HXWNR69]
MLEQNRQKQQSKKLVWEENFNEAKLNDAAWNIEMGDGCPNCGWGNNERQLYTNSNHRIENGNLIITAKKEQNKYTSTRITTKNKQEFKYGRVEARAKLPQGKGIWPAFWMLGANISDVGWPKCGEIDILEYVGKEPNFIYTTLHTNDSHGNSKNSKKTKIDSIEEGFHVYAVDWNEQKMEFYVDDLLVYTFQPQVYNENIWPFDQKFFIILNMAIGGNFGGPEVNDAIFPQEFIIDYIKVYQ